MLIYIDEKAGIITEPVRLSTLKVGDWCIYKDGLYLISDSISHIFTLTQAYDSENGDMAAIELLDCAEVIPAYFEVSIVSKDDSIAKVIRSSEGAYND